MLCISNCAMAINTGQMPTVGRILDLNWSALHNM